jgi:hypothetical protein
MKLTPEPIEAQRFQQLAERRVGGYVIRRTDHPSNISNRMRKHNIIHIEYEDGVDKDRLKASFADLIDTLNEWRY